MPTETTTPSTPPVQDTGPYLVTVTRRPSNADGALRELIDLLAAADAPVPAYSIPVHLRSNGTLAWALDHGDVVKAGMTPSGGAMRYALPVSRRAFAALNGDDGVGTYAADVIAAHTADQPSSVRRRLFDAAHSLPADGGKLTLPDGTVIEVERVTLEHLWEIAWPVLFPDADPEMDIRSATTSRVIEAANVFYAAQEVSP